MESVPTVHQPLSGVGEASGRESIRGRQASYDEVVASAYDKTYTSTTTGMIIGRLPVRSESSCERNRVRPS